MNKERLGVSMLLICYTPLTICYSAAMANTAVSLDCLHIRQTVMSEIKFQFKVKFTHQAEIMQSRGKQCVICNSAYKRQLRILKQHTESKKLSLSNTFHFLSSLTIHNIKAKKRGQTCLKHMHFDYDFFCQKVCK